MAENHDTDAYLARNLHDGWTDAKGNAEVLSAEIASMTWPERLQAIDWFFWKLGSKLLDEDQAEAVIDRHLDAMRSDPAVARFVETAEHTLAAVLMNLDLNPRLIECADQALIYAVSPLAVHRNAVADWVTLYGVDAIARVLTFSPGHAFVVMARGFGDDALTLRARDAFWSTMLGRDVGF